MPGSVVLRQKGPHLHETLVERASSYFHLPARICSRVPGLTLTRRNVRRLFAVSVLVAYKMYEPRSAELTSEFLPTTST